MADPVTIGIMIAASTAISAVGAIQQGAAAAAQGVRNNKPSNTTQPLKNNKQHWHGNRQAQDSNSNDVAHDRFLVNSAQHWLRLASAWAVRHWILKNNQQSGLN
jgi:hypothetical protein